MSRVSILSSPYLLGFENLERVLERAAKSANDGYPPYNIEQLSQTAWRVSLAVAGFSAHDLGVTLEDNQLVIAGQLATAESPGKDDESAYLHRGIARRQFQRRFVLGDGVEVTGASLENGLLNIELVRPVSKPVIKKIEITSAG